MNSITVDYNTVAKWISITRTDVAWWYFTWAVFKDGSSVRVSYSPNRRFLNCNFGGDRKIETSASFNHSTARYNRGKKCPLQNTARWLEVSTILLALSDNMAGMQIVASSSKRSAATGLFSLIYISWLSEDNLGRHCNWRNTFGTQQD